MVRSPVSPVLGWCCCDPAAAVPGDMALPPGDWRSQDSCRAQRRYRSGGGLVGWRCLAAVRWWLGWKVLGGEGNGQTGLEIQNE